MEIEIVAAALHQELIHKVNTLLAKIDKPNGFKQEGFTWISNPEFCRLLGVTKRTAQTYRDKRMVSFSQIGSKIYYKSTDVEAFLQKHHIKSATR